MYNILICDDEKDIVSALSIYLSTENYQVFTAYTGQEALEVVAQNDIHLMVCHLNSYSRELLNNQTPFALMQSKEQKKLLELLNLSPVPPDEVMLSPALFKH